MTEIEVVTECDDCNTQFDDGEDTKECFICNTHICDNCQNDHATKHCFEDKSGIDDLI